MRMTVWTVFCWLYLYYSLCNGYTQDALKDEIASLPGAPSALKSKHFSGHLPITTTRFIHYFFIESERDPKNDPLVFWTNGGPGCSGLLGLFTEMGPWRPTSNSTLESNPFAWTTLANMVFLEQPVGVGFSYTFEQDIITHFNDYRAAMDNLEIIKTFFKRYPEQAGKGFYLASESYGGHYIPQWSLAILNDQSSTSLKDQFLGYLVGNPYTSYASGSIAGANIMWGLQLIPKPLWDLSQSYTCELLSHDAYFFAEYLPQCFDVIDAFYNYTGLLNPYALDFPTCEFGTGIRASASEKIHKHKLGRMYSGTHQSRLMRDSRHRVRNHLLAREGIKGNVRSDVEEVEAIPSFHTRDGPISSEEISRDAKELLSMLVGQSLLSESRSQSAMESPASSTQSETPTIQYRPCTEYLTLGYLNNPQVQEALHVRRDGQNVPWEACNDDVNENWASNDFLADTTHLYSQIFNHPAKRKDFKMLVFSGDSDGVCATVGTQHWVYQVEGTSVLSLYQPWQYYDSEYGLQQGGFLTQFSGRFSFATVHYAGHEVPAYQPQSALALFQRYLNGSLFSESSSEGSTSSSAGDGGAVLEIVLACLLVVVVLVGLAYCFSPKVKELLGGSKFDIGHAEETHY